MAVASLAAWHRFVATRAATVAAEVGEYGAEECAMIPALVELNALGYVTFDSQDGSHVPAADGELVPERAIMFQAAMDAAGGAGAEATRAYAAAGGKFVLPQDGLSHKQRAYIVGAMLPAEAAVFTELMLTQTDKIVLLGGGQRFPVTCAYGANTVFNKLYDNELAGLLPPCTRVSGRDAREAYDLPEELLGCSVHVSCFDPLWGRRAAGPDGLITEVTAMLRRACEVVARGAKAA